MTTKKVHGNSRKWTDEERGLVRGMAIGGVPHKRIAKYLNTTDETLRLHFRNELDFGLDEIKALAHNSLVHNLRENHPAMTMFFFKTQCGWRETVEVEHSGSVEYVDRPDRVSREEWIKQYQNRASLN